MTTTQEPLAMWGGGECTVNRVGNRWFDQLAWTGHDRRLDDLDRFATAAAARPGDRCVCRRYSGGRED
jgi:hypothetical protein